MKDPWLSVLIPNRNGAEYLARALDSIVAQQDDSIEVIAVDDGSTDESVDIFKSYSGKLQLELVEAGQLQNWPAVANLGLSVARADYACILHHDDEWTPGRLSALRKALGERRQAHLIVHPSWYIDSFGRRLGTLKCPLRPGNSSPAEVLPKLLVQNFFAPPAPVFLRTAAQSVGGLDEGLWYAPDWDLWLKLASLGTTRHIIEPFSAYRVHPRSLTSTRTKSRQDYRYQQEVVLERHLAALNALTPEVSAIEPAARFSIEANLALAALSHGQRPEMAHLLGRLRALRPTTLKDYVRYSRITDRVLARLRPDLLFRRPETF